MATWAIGDVQGCFDSLERLVEAIGFDRHSDHLWFAGDLVNRGPRSADVLRFVRDLGDRAVAVLGNHDLNLLAVAAGHRKPRKHDTVHDVLDAPDHDDLVDWLRACPLEHTEGRYTMIHAGLLREWSLDECAAMARRAERHLRGDDWIDLLGRMYPNGRPDADPNDRDAWTLATMTYVRGLDEDGVPTKYSGPPDACPEGVRPWFEGRNDERTILFGHWAAAGFDRGPGWVALDSGCVWGDGLTAFCLEDERVVRVPTAEAPDDLPTGYALT